MQIPDQQPNPSNVSKQILERIEFEQIAPTPRYTFVLREWGIWSLWFFTVLIGALAVSVTLYVGMSAQYALYEATHTNFLTFLVTVLPYLWVLLFGLMVYLALVELRQTKRGYRYNSIEILGSSLLFSLLGGLLFQYAGFGYVLDQSLGRQITQYMSMEKMELKLWQSPEQGRLVGILVPQPETIDGPAAELQFEDADGITWQVSQNELNPREVELLTTKERVRLLGTSTAPSQFHVCGVFPWMYDKAMARAEMEHERREFESRMQAHRKMIVRGDDGRSEPVEVPADTICSHLKMMERMRIGS